MASYRCHFLDRMQRLKHVAEIEARSRGEAMVLKTRPEHSFEIWLRG
jgi:hypothetical protein